MLKKGSSLRVDSGVDTGDTKIDSDIIINGSLELKTGISSISNKVLPSQMAFLSGSQEGVAISSKALILDSNKGIKGINDINSDGDISVNRYGENSLSSSLILKKARGTEEVPQITNIADTLGNVSFQSYGSLTYGTMVGALTLEESASSIDNYYKGLHISISNPDATGTINEYTGTINEYIGNGRIITSITWNNNATPTTSTWTSTTYNIYGNSTLASISSLVNTSNKNDRLVGEFSINTVAVDHPTLDRNLNQRIKIDNRGNLSIMNNHMLKLCDNSNSHFVGFKASENTAAPGYTIELPGSEGIVGQVLQINSVSSINDSLFNVNAPNISNNSLLLKGGTITDILYDGSSMVVGGEDAINIEGLITRNSDNDLFLDLNSSSIDGYYINSQLEISNVSEYGYITDYDSSTRKITVDWYNSNGNSVTMPSFTTNTSYKIYLHKSGIMEPSGTSGTMSNTLNLASSASDQDDAYNGMSISINGGASVGTITDYTGSSRAIIVDWEGTTPTTNGPPSATTYNILAYRLNGIAIKIDNFYKDQRIILSGAVSNSGIITNYDSSTKDITVVWDVPSPPFGGPTSIPVNTTYTIYGKNSGKMTSPLTLPSYASSVDDHYNNCRIRVTNQASNTLTVINGLITDYNGPTKVINVTWDDTSLPADGGTDQNSLYTIYMPIGNAGDFDNTNPPEIMVNGSLNEDIIGKKISNIIPNIEVSSGKILSFSIIDEGFGYNQTPIIKVPMICKTGWAGSGNESTMILPFAFATVRFPTLGGQAWATTYSNATMNANAYYPSSSYAIANFYFKDENGSETPRSDADYYIFHNIDSASTNTATTTSTSTYCRITSKDKSGFQITIYYMQNPSYMRLNVTVYSPSSISSTASSGGISSSTEGGQGITISSNKINFDPLSLTTNDTPQVIQLEQGGDYLLGIDAQSGNASQPIPVKIPIFNLTKRLGGDGMYTNASTGRIDNVKEQNITDIIGNTLQIYSNSDEYDIDVKEESSSGINIITAIPKIYATQSLHKVTTGMVLTNPGAYFPVDTFVSFVSVDSVYGNPYQICLSNISLQPIPADTKFVFKWQNTLRTGIDRFERFEISTNVTQTNTLRSNFVNALSLPGQYYSPYNRKYIKNIEFSTYTGNPDVNAGEFIFNVGKIPKNYPFKVNDASPLLEEELNNKILTINDNELKMTSGFVSSVIISDVSSGESIPSGNLRTKATIRFESPSNGVTALGRPVINSNGNLESIIIDEPGEGYIVPPDIEFKNGEGIVIPFTNKVVIIGNKNLTGQIGGIIPYDGFFSTVKSKIYQYDSSEVLLGKNVGGISTLVDYEGGEIYNKYPEEGKNNVYIGNESGRYTDNTSSENVFLGYFSGQSSSTHETFLNNVFIGNNAGYQYPEPEPGSNNEEVVNNNIVIGNNSKVGPSSPPFTTGMSPADNTTYLGNNKLYIDSSIHKSNKSLIYGDMEHSESTNRYLRINGDLQIGGGDLQNPGGGDNTETLSGNYNPTRNLKLYGNLELLAVPGMTKSKGVRIIFPSDDVVSTTVEGANIVDQPAKPHYNTLLGYNTGGNTSASVTGTIYDQSQDGGDYNTIVGYNSGKSVQSGNKNTFLGSLSGSIVSSGSSNITIGYNISPAYNENNRVIIDTKEKSNTDALIYGNQSSSINTLNLNADITISNNNSLSNGNLIVSGTTTLNGNTNISGTNTFDVGTGASTLGGNLTVGGTVILNGNTNISGANTLTVGTGTTTLGGNLTVGGTIGVTGVTTLDGNTNITGTNTLTVGTGASTLGGNLTVGGTLGVTGVTTLDGNTNITGTNTLTIGTGTTSMGGNLTVGGTLGITGATTLDGNTNITGTNTFTVGTGETALGGKLTIGGNLDVDGNTILDGNLTVNGEFSQSDINSAEIGIIRPSRGKFTRLESTSNIFNIGTQNNLDITVNEISTINSSNTITCTLASGNPIEKGMELRKNTYYPLDTYVTNVNGNTITLSSNNTLGTVPNNSVLSFKLKNTYILNESFPSIYKYKDITIPAQSNTLTIEHSSTLTVNMEIYDIITTTLSLLYPNNTVVKITNINSNTITLSETSLNTSSVIADIFFVENSYSSRNKYLKSNVSGNLFIGGSAIKSTNEASNNIIIGNSGNDYNITTGTSNILFGKDTGKSINMGERNILIGGESGNKLKGSSDNIYIGDSSGLKLADKISILTVVNDNSGVISSVTDQINSNIIIIDNSNNRVVSDGWLLNTSGYFPPNVKVTEIENTTINESPVLKLTMDNSNNTIIPSGTSLDFINNNPPSHVNTQASNTIASRIHLNKYLPEHNVSIGNSSSKYLSKSMDDVYLGYKSGYGVLSNLGETFYNVVIGSKSGYKYIQANTNTVVGCESNYQNQNGFGNVCLGYKSGYFNTGSNCIFIGPETGEKSDNSNVSGKLYIDPRGLNNGEPRGDQSFIYGDMKEGDEVPIPELTINGSLKITQGGINSEVGKLIPYSGRFTQVKLTEEANNNVYYGYSTGLGTNNTGEMNVFIGEETGGHEDNFSGTTNVGVGYRAGYKNISGKGNVLLGNSAGYYNTSDNNICIGVNSGTVENGSSDNKLYIECSDEPRGSNSYIYGDMSSCLLSLNSDVTISNNSANSNGSLTVSGVTNLTGSVTVGSNGAGSNVTFFGATSGAYMLWNKTNDDLELIGAGLVQSGSGLNTLTGATTFSNTVTVGENDTGYDVKFFGGTLGAYMLWDEGGDELLLGKSGFKINDGTTDNFTVASDGTLTVKGPSTFSNTVTVGENDTGYDV